MSLRSICVFCGASRGTNPVYEQAAQDLGRTLAANGIRLVYGGGAVGLMGVVADATMAAGGEVIGIIPQSLKDAEVGHTGLSRLEVVDGMHARKARMAELADAFIALPGGLGTLEELFEVWTWASWAITPSHSACWTSITSTASSATSSIIWLKRASSARSTARCCNAAISRRA